MFKCRDESWLCSRVIQCAKQGPVDPQKRNKSLQRFLKINWTVWTSTFSGVQKLKYYVVMVINMKIIPQVSVDITGNCFMLKIPILVSAGHLCDLWVSNIGNIYDHFMRIIGKMTYLSRLSLPLLNVRKGWKAGYTIFTISQNIVPKHTLQQVTWPTKTFLRMLRLQEVVAEHAQCANLLHFLFQTYKYPTQGACFHQVTSLCYSEHLLHIADNSQVDRILLFIFLILT